MTGGRECAREYAAALANVARASGDVERFLPPLEALAEAVRADARVAALFSSPYAPRSERARLASELAGALGLPPEVGRFLELVARRRRGRLLPAIVEAYRGICDEEIGRVKGRVVSAVALSDEVRAELRRRLAAILKREPKLTYEEDPSLIGGFVVFVGSRMFDLSVRGALARLVGE